MHCLHKSAVGYGSMKHIWTRHLRYLSLVGLVLSQLVLNLIYAAEAGSKRSCEAALSGPGISLEWVQSLQNQRTESPVRRRLQQSIQMLGFEDVALNRDILKSHNRSYTHELPSGLPANQMKSGRCWIFAPLNVLRDEFISRLNLPPTFQLSQTYLYFFSLLEKSNAQLEQVIKIYSKNSSDKKRRDAIEVGVGDGGLFEWFLFLADKYGIVPRSAMPEASSSVESEALLGELNEYLGRFSLQLASLADQQRQNNVSRKDILESLRAQKLVALRHIYEILSTHLGHPPRSFDLRADLQDEEGDKQTIIRRFTPHSFAKDALGFDPNDWVVVANYPEKEEGRVYHGKDTHIGGENSAGIRFLNVSVERMIELAVNSIGNGVRVDVAVDMNGPIHHPTGIMHPEIFETEALYRTQRGVTIPDRLTRRQRVLTSTGGANHAMAIIGIDVSPRNNQLIKFKIENSWGDEAGDDGFLHMYVPYFMEHVYRIAVPKRVLNESETAALSRPHVISDPEDLMRISHMMGVRLRGI